MACGAPLVVIAVFISTVPPFLTLGTPQRPNGERAIEETPAAGLAAGAGHLHHAAHLAERPHDAVELVDVTDHYLEAVDRLLVGYAVHLGAADVDAGAADGLAHVRQQSRFVDAHDLDGHRSRRRRAFVPHHFDAPLRIALEHPRAVDGVHGHAAPARRESQDALAGQRIAALPEAHHDVVETA